VKIVTGRRDKSLTAIFQEHKCSEEGGPSGGGGDVGGEGEGFDICLVSVVNAGSGTIPWGRCDDLRKLKEAALKKNGIMMPSKVCLMAQAISCRYLAEHAEVSPQATLGLNLNALLPHRPAMVSVELTASDFEALAPPICVFEEIGSQLQQESEVSVTVNKQGFLHGLLCWCVERWGPDESIDFGPHQESGTFASQVAFLPPVFLPHAVGDPLIIMGKEDDSEFIACIEASTSIQTDAASKKRKV